MEDCIKTGLREIVCIVCGGVKQIGLAQTADVCVQSSEVLR